MSLARGRAFFASPFCGAWSVDVAQPRVRTPVVMAEDLDSSARIYYAVKTPVSSGIVVKHPSGEEEEVVTAASDEEIVGMVGLARTESDLWFASRWRENKPGAPRSSTYLVHVPLR